MHMYPASRPATNEPLDQLNPMTAANRCTSTLHTRCIRRVAVLPCSVSPETTGSEFGGIYSRFQPNICFYDTTTKLHCSLSNMSAETSKPQKHACRWHPADLSVHRGLNRYGQYAANCYVLGGAPEAPYFRAPDPEVTHHVLPLTRNSVRALPGPESWKPRDCCPRNRALPRTRTRPLFVASQAPQALPSTNPLMQIFLR
jgi:hypothetical protein